MNLLSLFFVLLSYPLFDADTTRYIVLTVGKPSGKHLKWSDHQGHLAYHYEYNDRGRGPSINVNMQLDTSGLVVSRQAVGHDYYKAPVNESFVSADGFASWKNHIENETRPLSGRAIYSPLNSVPAEIETMVKVLHREAGNELPTLPSGKIKATHLKSHASQIDGKPIALELYSLSGSGGPPAYFWFKPSKDFFASVSGWRTVIEEGHEELIEELKQLQDQLEENYFYEQAAQLTHTPKTRVVVENVSVFDSPTGKTLENQSVVIENDRIIQIGKVSKVKTLPTDETIDGSGKMLLPGLWDNHSHYSIDQGLYHLAAGVTNVKDLANSLDLPELVQKLDTDELLGPEISVLSGFIDFAGPYAGPTGKIVKTLEEGLEAVDYYANNGYQQIKLYSSIPPDWVKPMAERAHQRGIKVCGHVPSFMTAERAVKDGFDQIIHLNMIMLNFLGDTLDTRSMLRFTRVAERARNIDLESEEVQRFLALLNKQKIVVDPTAAIFEDMFVNQPGQLAKGYDAVVELFPADFKRSLYYGGLPTMKGHIDEYRESFENMVKMLKLLYENGITMVPGTDDFPGFTLHRELELYAQAGIPNTEVLRMATLISAQVAGKADEFGTIAAGKKANMILVEGNPVTNISDIRKVVLTIKNGNLYYPLELYESYGFGFWK